MPTIREALRHRVLTAIDRLGHTPSALARGLRHKHAHTLDMILLDSANPFTTEIVHRIECASFAQSYCTILFNIGHAVLFDSEEGI
jgi:DNA-binding LacI/PurR family transcriptional regulator